MKKAVAVYTVSMLALRCAHAEFSGPFSLGTPGVFDARFSSGINALKVGEWKARGVTVDTTRAPEELQLTGYGWNSYLELEKVPAGLVTFTVAATNSGKGHFKAIAGQFWPTARVLHFSPDPGQTIQIQLYEGERLSVWAVAESTVGPGGEVNQPPFSVTIRNFSFVPAAAGSVLNAPRLTFSDVPGLPGVVDITWPNKHPKVSYTLQHSTSPSQWEQATNIWCGVLTNGFRATNLFPGFYRVRVETLADRTRVSPHYLVVDLAGDEPEQYTTPASFRLQRIAGYTTNSAIYFIEGGPLTDDPFEDYTRVFNELFQDPAVHGVYRGYWRIHYPQTCFYAVTDVFQVGHGPGFSSIDFAALDIEEVERQNGWSLVRWTKPKSNYIEFRDRMRADSSKVMSIQAFIPSCWAFP